MKPIKGNDRDRGAGLPRRRTGAETSLPGRPAQPRQDEDAASAVSPNQDRPTTKPNDGQSELKVDSSSQSADKIGLFEIEELLEQSDGWVTYWATDPRFDREVLIKVAGRETFPTAQAEIDFQNEISAARILSHTSIVPVVGSGKCSTGSYAVYQRCPGVTLDRWLREQQEPIHPQSAAALVQCLADGVQHAHQRGILHRGLNPRNILIDRSEEDKPKWTPIQVRINHYGLGNAEPENKRQEEAGRATDALAYCSPEQRRGDAEITTATDIYSLGAILYRLLTGQAPPLAETAAGQGQSPSVTWPPSRESQQPVLDPVIQSICCKCLSHSPADRTTTAFELADELIYCYQDRTAAQETAGGLKKLLRWPR